MQKTDFNEFLRQNATPFNVPDFKHQSEELKRTTDNVPEGHRTPTETELKAIHLFIQRFRKQKPKASERNVRRAVQQKFNIKILPDTLKQ